MKNSVIALILGLFIISAASAQAEEPMDDYRILFEMKQGRLPKAIQPTDDDIYHYDVTHEDIDIRVEFASEYIYGTVIMTAESFVNNLSTVMVDFYDNMNIDSITRGTIPLSYTRQNNQIFITLDTPVNVGEEFSLTIVYNGHPTGGGFQAFAFQTHQGIPIASSLSEPEEARSWWPCKDVPWEKFTAEIRYTVPDYMIAASNGLLVEIINNPDDTKTYHWVENYPITTYLISIAATNYEYFNQDYLSLYGDSMSIDYYVFPEHFTQAQSAFSTMPDIMEFYESVFGEYPFIDEKYGHAIFMWSGGMEHQTMTSIGHNIMSLNYEWLYAHELAHMWWGDMVTCGTWMDIWLNEGFATYSDALYKQFAYGQAAFVSRMSSFRQTYFWEDMQNRFPIYDPVNMWGGTVYQKGAWILHMLRWVGGEDNFWNFFPAYRDSFEYSYAVTEDLQATFEAVYDTTLDWFFDEWVYMAGYPEYEWGYSATSIGGDLWEVDVSIRQEQNLINQTPIFTMPLPFRVVTAAQTYDFTCWDSLQQQMFTFTVEGQPSSVSYDPDSWILDTRQQVTFFLPDLQVVLEPDSATLTIPPTGGHLRFEVELTNNTGSAVSTDVWTGAVLPDGSTFGPIILRQGVNLGPGATITRDLRQNVPANAPSGEYSYFILAGSFADTVTVAADAFNFEKEE